MLSTPLVTDISTDILILSNGPGELTTWVYPFLKALESAWRSPDDAAKTRISIALAPCQNASGQEAQLAKSFPNVDRVLPQEQFFDFLIWGKTPDWQWAKQGMVVFLGGDQFFALAIAKRLGYKTLIYAEWEARWYRWVDLFAVRNEAISTKIPSPFRHKAHVIGDLMVDRLDSQPQSESLTQKRICFMPGSKGHKLRIGVPLVVAIADILHQKYPDIELAIALAPTTTPEILATYAQFSFPTADSEGSTANLADGNLLTAKGTTIKIHREFPAHALIKSSQLCVTTVGANTAELASLHQPMIVLLPTNFTDMKIGWDGIWGLLAAAPLLGKVLSKIINSILISQIQKKGQLLAWPNIWAGEAIVPEFLGELTPTQIAEQIVVYLEHPEELEKVRDRLKQVCGEAGAASKLAAMVINAI
ncbi:glycosyltransferase family protein [Pseudanabaena yagii]|uniref:Lipid-A-disaccharide synthase n=1 Tax=Pseudanabaena yagii GIHE-NHR1 TaxID=2722753 RepID=A0ABX1LKS4_9CYAN|nr:lipid-A-disaccharide synthase [Pseudanabaena yagii]NMF56707.1 lipid-A-disaccharide synthase [Pseudanabaena yagii GIHE-NHR1]